MAQSKLRNSATLRLRLSITPLAYHPENCPRRRNLWVTDTPQWRPELEVTLVTGSLQVRVESVEGSTQRLPRFWRRKPACSAAMVFAVEAEIPWPIRRRAQIIEVAYDRPPACPSRKSSGPETWLTEPTTARLPTIRGGMCATL